MTEIITSERVGRPARERPFGDGAVLAHAIDKRLDDYRERVERAFEPVSDQLKGFSDRSSEISRMSLATAKVMGGDEIIGAIEGLRRMVENLRALFLETETANDGNLELLQRIRANLARVEHDLEALLDTSNNLRMLGLSTKIQSTRTGRSMATFLQLGEDISQMSGVILGKAEELIRQGGALSGLIGEIYVNLAALKTKQSRLTRDVLDGTLKVIGSLEEISGNSKDEVARIAHWAREIERSLREVGEAIHAQKGVCRDIGLIRESVNNALGGVLPGEPPRDADLHPGIRAALECRRQARRFRDGARSLTATAGTIVGGFENMRVNFADMAQVTGASCEASTRFCEELERGIRSVSSLLSEVVASGREVSSLMGSLGRTVEGMSIFTKDIEAISSDVELISMNARIKAAQTGEKGAGMGVIAGAIQKTALMANEYRESFLEKLGAVRKAAASLQDAMEATSRGEESKLDTAVRELGVFLDALKIMQERIIATYRSMEVKGRGLSENLGAASSGVRRFHREQGIGEELALHLEGGGNQAARDVPILEFAIAAGAAGQATLAMGDTVGDRLLSVEVTMKGRRESVSQTHVVHEATDAEKE